MILIYRRCGDTLLHRCFLGDASTSDARLIVRFDVEPLPEAKTNGTRTRFILSETRRDRFKCASSSHPAACRTSSRVTTISAAGHLLITSNRRSVQHSLPVMGMHDTLARTM